MDIKNMDIDAVANAIEVDASESLPDLRQALKEAKAAMAVHVVTAPEKSANKSEDDKRRNIADALVMPDIDDKEFAPPRVTIETPPADFS